jgi:hypothetical protein
MGYFQSVYDKINTGPRSDAIYIARAVKKQNTRAVMGEWFPPALVFTAAVQPFHKRQVLQSLILCS